MGETKNRKHQGRLDLLGQLLLVVSALYIFFGYAFKMLVHLNLTEGQALSIIGLTIGGSFINVPALSGIGMGLSFNVGGVVIPVLIAIYFFGRMKTTGHILSGIAAILFTGALVYGISRIFGSKGSIDPTWILGITSGISGFIVARAPQPAFVAATLGIPLAEFAYLAGVYKAYLPVMTVIGGGGTFDAIILAGLIALTLAEITTESRVGS